MKSKVISINDKSTKKILKFLSIKLKQGRSFWAFEDICGQRSNEGHAYQICKVSEALFYIII